MLHKVEFRCLCKVRLLVRDARWDQSVSDNLMNQHALANQRALRHHPA